MQNGGRRAMQAGASETMPVTPMPGVGTLAYFRDPDGNLLEFATPGLWENY